MARKKPPPGATLISRLREGKARRQKAIEDKAAKDADSSDAAGQPETVEAEIIDARESFATESPSPGAKAGLPAPVKGPAKVDLIHADISLDDLKPRTDDYDVLTEEIRLAGRFAAVGLIAQGLRLSRLKDEELYKRNHPTFEDYCRVEHNMSATYAYRLIRISEMAERLAEEKAGAVGAQVGDAMPDPFEVMLGLGHRHIMTLLPLEADIAEDLLTRGVPLDDESGQLKGRIPINEASEKQIREALRRIVAPAGKADGVQDTAKLPPRIAVRKLDDIAECMLAWVKWLDSGPLSQTLDKELGGVPEISSLLAKLESASQKLQDCLRKQKKS